MSRIFPVLMTIALSAVPALSQSRISDELIVSIPREAYAGDKALPSGEYRIRQVPSTNNHRILAFVDKDGRTVQASVAAIPALNNSGADATVVELKQVGNRQYISRIWIEGKAYGYELPVPEGMAGAANTASIEMKVGPAPAVVAQAAPPQPAPEPTPAPEPAATPPPAPQPPPQPEPQQQATPPPAPQPPPQPEPQQQAQAQPPPQPEPPAAPAQTQAPPMPETADGSMPLFALAGAALILYGAFSRPRQRE